MGLQMNQVRERFSQVEQCIGNAVQTCEMSSDVPEKLRTCLTELSQESEHAREAVENRQVVEEDDGHVRQCIDKLEKLGDRAMQACSQGSYVDDQVKNAVRQARKAISAMKQQLH